MKNNTLMFAERTFINEEFFLEKIPKDMPEEIQVNMMMIYKGSYRVFHSDNLERVSQSLDDMIKSIHLTLKPQNDQKAKQTLARINNRGGTKPQGYNSV